MALTFPGRPPIRVGHASRQAAATAAGKLVRPTKKTLQFGQETAWQRVSSSWIEALRFVPVQRPSSGTRGGRTALGFVDMRTIKGKRRYRYGTRQLIGMRTYESWVVAASKGKWWWRYVTARYSPAVKF